MHPGRDIIVIGASAGGVETLRRLIGLLPADLPATIFIVLHIWADSTSYLPAILQRTSALSIRHPEHEESIKQGTIYIAPPDHHLMLERERVLVVRGPRENRARPAINPLFRTAAAAFGTRVIGVVLTGTLDDGTAGLWAIKHCGGTTVVQDPKEALFPEMPQNALNNVAVDHCLPLNEIAVLLVRLSRAPVARVAPEVPAVVKLNNQGVKMETIEIEIDKVGRRSMFSCPECSGALWEIDEGGQLQYRCHVGHGYSPRSLASEQNLVIEQALWGALRALKESAALDERLAVRSEEHRLEKAAAAHRANADEKKQQAEQLLAYLHSFTKADAQQPADAHGAFLPGEERTGG